MSRTLAKLLYGDDFSAICLVPSCDNTLDGPGYLCKECCDKVVDRTGTAVADYLTRHRSAGDDMLKCLNVVVQCMLYAAYDDSHIDAKCSRPELMGRIMRRLSE